MLQNLWGTAVRVEMESGFVKIDQISMHMELCQTAPFCRSLVHQP